jgi:glycerol-3-phosphate acyltransferase PlsX
LLDIALDAMGSDKAPDPEIRGAILACHNLPVRVHLIGPEDRIRSGLRAAARSSLRRNELRSASDARTALRKFLDELPIEIVHTNEWISMEDKAATAIRKKPNSTMRIGLKLVKDGTVAAFFTAGNTGAAMATAKMVLGVIPGVDRPALVSIMPTSTGQPSILLDVGANVDCKVHHLEQFAVMGNIYAKKMLGVERPRVGLLSIGEEESKGNELTREAFAALKELPLCFLGNVEGRDIYNGNADVIVCDGFVGNVALKTSEGLAKFIVSQLRESLKSTITAKVGALLSQKAFADFKKRVDYAEYGGVPLLGLRGVCIIGHGSSNEKAIFNGIRVAAEFSQAGVNASIEQELAGHSGKGAHADSEWHGQNGR